MKLTIIPEDKAIYKDGLCYSKLSLTGIPFNIHALQFDAIKNEGWLEYNDGTANEDITQLPSWVDGALEAWTNADNNADKYIETVDESTITDAQLEAIIIDDRNKRLASSDWTQLPDVIALHDDVWLTNWRAYRQALRDMSLNLDVHNPIFPVPPL